MCFGTGTTSREGGDNDSVFLADNVGKDERDDMMVMIKVFEKKDNGGGENG